MILDQTGSLANMKRHDYLPFGEELIVPTGGRSAAQGYAGGDGVRQQFTAKERDSETWLDYFIHRNYSPVQGRFVSPDILFADQSELDPQSWNLYSYVANAPTIYTDPFGLWKQVDCNNGGQCWESNLVDDTYESLAQLIGVSAANLREYFQNEEITLGTVFDVSNLGYPQTLNVYNPDEFLRIKGGPAHIRRRDFWGIGPEMTIGSGTAFQGGTRGASWLGRTFMRFRNWLGFGEASAAAATAALRKAYEAEVRNLVVREAEMRAAGHTVEEIAIELHAARRALGQIYKDMTPPELLQKILQRNLEKYGDELGPTMDWLRARGKTFEEIIESAKRPGGEDLKP